MTLMTLACAEGKSWQSSWGTLWENGLMAGFAIFCSDSMIYLNLFNTISLGHGHSWPNVGNCYDETQQSLSRQVANKQSSVRVVKAPSRIHCLCLSAIFLSSKCRNHRADIVKILSRMKGSRKLLGLVLGRLLGHTS